MAKLKTLAPLTVEVGTSVAADQRGDGCGALPAVVLAKVAIMTKLAT